MLDETIVIIFAELTRFHKSEDECETEQDKLLYLLKNSAQMTVPPKWGEEKPCKSILDAFHINDFSREKREKYDKDMYDEKRRNGELAAAKEDCRVEGLAAGRAEGHAEGLAEGQVKGRAEGERKKQIEVARKMLAAGMQVEQIVEFTGLDRDTVEKL